MIVLVIIVLILAIILYLPVSVEVKYIEGQFDYKVRYAFITFYPKIPKKKVSKKKSKRTKINRNKIVKDESKSVSHKSNENNTNTTDTDHKKSLSRNSKPNPNNSDLNALETVSLVLDIFKAIKDNLGKFITNIKITDLYIDFHIADVDAYDCALKFGKLSTVIGNLLGFLQWNFKVKKKSISICPKYNSNNSVYDISFKVKIGLGKGLRKIFVMLFKVLPILKDNEIIK